MVISDATEINRRLFHDLWRISTASGVPSRISPRLILPVKRNKQLRVSEQEARFLYCSIVNSLSYYYSVETPTHDVYKQTGRTPQSASTDLTLYINNNRRFEKVLNVEFKAHNAAEESVRKDIEKLMKEGIDGNWVHTLKNVNSRSIPRIFEKLANALKSCRSLVSKKRISILFCFCVMDKRWGCIKHFLFESSATDFRSYVDSFFDLKYSVKKGSICVEGGTWEIVK